MNQGLNIVTGEKIKTTPIRWNDQFSYISVTAFRENLSMIPTRYDLHDKLKYYLDTSEKN